MRKLGWKKDPEFHQVPLRMPRMLGTALPAATDLEPMSPACYDQGQLGSCTAHAIVGVFEIKARVEGRDVGPAARLFVYQMELLMQGTPWQDEGSTIPTGMRVALTFGLPPETAYPYDPSRLAVRPARPIYALGRQHRATRMMESAVVNEHDHIVAMLAGNDAIACGFAVPSSFMSDDVAKTGVWNGPQPGDTIVGGHAIAIVGHDDVKGMYKIRNSWGTSWGQNGHVWVPQSFVHDQFQDLMAAVDAPK